MSVPKPKKWPGLPGKPRVAFAESTGSWTGGHWVEQETGEWQLSGPIKNSRAAAIRAWNRRIERAEP